MSGLRFKLGEMARFVVARSPASSKLVGFECEVIAVGPWRADVDRIDLGVRGRWTARFDSDYVVDFGRAGLAAAADWQLRKLNPSDESKLERKVEELEEATS